MIHHGQKVCIGFNFVVHVGQIYLYGIETSQKARDTDQMLV